MKIQLEIMPIQVDEESLSLYKHVDETSEHEMFYSSLQTQIEDSLSSYEEKEQEVIKGSFLYKIFAVNFTV